MGRLKLVRVDWVDSAQPYGCWNHLSDLPPLEVVECKTVGWLVAESDEVLMLAQNLGDVNTESAQASGLMRIPRVCVKRIAVLCQLDGGESGTNALN
ncbi:hypothetical protein [Microbulbifer sp. TYP-18]|uniref:hypothetical protein n=1 Tax=Microbulbifer sp. TYP-18 TaxID=3230024 RepID=UPI0034C62866